MSDLQFQKDMNGVMQARIDLLHTGYDMVNKLVDYQRARIDELQAENEELRRHLNPPIEDDGSQWYIDGLISGRIKATKGEG